MTIASFIDLPSVAVVLGGTLVATFLRSGWKDCGLAIGALATIGAKRFDADQARAEVAAQVRSIQKDGLLRAHPRRLADREMDEVADTLIGTRSVEALLARHEAQKAARVEADERAVRTWAQASELAPVFGLAGTLISLTELPSDGIAREAYMNAISMAVLCTLYGLLLANIVFGPIARWIDRVASQEERERQKIVDWLAGQVGTALPRTKGKPVAVPEVMSA